MSAGRSPGGASIDALRQLASPLTWTLLAITLAIAIVSAIAWISQVGRGDWIPEWRAVRGGLLPLVALLTLLNLVIRFLRWQFLLRSVGVRLPIRASAVQFAAGLTTILTPAYAGEVLKPLLLRRAFGTSTRVSLSVVLVERGLDVLTLALIAAFVVDSRHAAIAGLVLAAILILLPRLRAWLWRGVAVADRLRQRLFLARAVAPSAEALARLAAPAVSVPALVLSFAAWGPACVALALTARAGGWPIAPGDAAHLFATSTLTGGLSLAPGGVAVVGGMIIAGLVRSGADLPRAILVATLFRILTVGVALLLGLLALPRALRRVAGPGAHGVARHFDALSAKYHMQLPRHVRERLVRRKSGVVAAQLRALAPGARRGLEVGCGRGWELEALGDEGYHLTGADLAPGQVAAAAQSAGRACAAFVAADARRLPFPDGAFDFAYTIGTLHHIEAADDQARALAEMGRVVRPGGAVIVLETNPRNPLFRLYMGYVFPVIRDIDVGSELWLDPRRVQPPAGLEPAGLAYFSFLPDFLPASLDRALLPLERRLEASRAAPWSAHYLLSWRKRAAPG